MIEEVIDPPEVKEAPHQRELREHHAGPQLRVAVRAHRSRPLV